MRTYSQRRSLRSALLLPVVGALLLAGCSGGEEAEPSGAPAASTEASAEASPSPETSPTEETPEAVEEPEEVDLSAVEPYPRLDNPFEVDFSTVVVPPEVVALVGEEAASRLAPEMTSLLWMFRNQVTEYTQNHAEAREETMVEGFRAHMTPGAFNDLHASVFGADEEDMSAWNLMNGVSPEGTFDWNDYDAGTHVEYHVRSGGSGVTTRLVSPPVIDWVALEDGSPSGRASFNIVTRYDMVEGKFEVASALFLYPQLGEDGTWLLAGWWEEIQGGFEKVE